MILVLVLLPLLAFCVISIFGKFIGTRGSSFVSVLCVFTSFLLSSYFLADLLWSMNIYTLKLFPWLNINLLLIYFGFYIDILVVLMLFVVTLISFLVHLYSIGYMAGDPHFSRFLAYLSLFTFFMLFLVTSDNLVQAFFGWEGVGLSSFLLINFWFMRILAVKSALKAMLLNKIGDCSFLVFIVLVYQKWGSLDYLEWLPLVNGIYPQKLPFLFWTLDDILLLNIFLIVAAVAKSAQFGLHIWLPDAMEGPTPVSALLHAATMVTAGVFLLIRCASLLEASDLALFFLSFLGAFTMLFAGMIGATQFDLKRTIAFSTCSQLGLMFLACGFSQYSIAMYHLVNHAFFKALLFLTAGIIIHAVSDAQDVDYLGNTSFSLSLSTGLLTMGSSAIMALMLSSGFFSKDLILESCVSNFSELMALVNYLIIILATFYSSFYSSRQFFSSLNDFPNISISKLSFAVTISPFMLFPVLLLLLLSIFFGFWGFELFSYLNLFWDTLFITSLELTHYNTDWAEYVSPLSDLFPLIISFSAFILGALSNYYTLPFTFVDSLIKLPIFSTITKKWGIDNFYSAFFVSSFFSYSFFGLFRSFDRGFLDYILVKFWVTLLENFSKIVVKLHSGLVSYYFTYCFVVFGSLITGFWDDYLLWDLDEKFFFVLLYSIFLYFLEEDDSKKKIIK